ncbi:hypothetical protein ARMGADRAFT_752778 [Armillaria gallica]|uniref:Uncharacterized protein n=1 Tax=Armillaria gallica TaxID=47427 RepID=A0A2H3DPU7_ARMGA|nr:hypothetical protein ARMGADRAFT_752778 [Armillaria gallica]
MRSRAELMRSIKLRILLVYHDGPSLASLPFWDLPLLLGTCLCSSGPVCVTLDTPMHPEPVSISNQPQCCKRSRMMKACFLV